jgi:hypothetical protein
MTDYVIVYGQLNGAYDYLALSHLRMYVGICF